MAKSNPTFQKRQRERKRQERKEEKVRRKRDRDKGKEDQVDLLHEPGVDPDIAGIKPGPQPIPVDDEDIAPAPKDDPAEATSTTV